MADFTKLNGYDVKDSVARTNISKFNLINFNTYDSTNTTISNGTIETGLIHVATNSDGSIGKIYSDIDITPTAQSIVSITFNTLLRPTTDIFISACGICRSRTTYYIDNCYMDIKTTGEVTLYINPTDTGINNVVYFPCLYFMKDFGDSPNE